MFNKVNLYRSHEITVRYTEGWFKKNPNAMPVYDDLGEKTIGWLHAESFQETLEMEGHSNLMYIPIYWVGTNHTTAPIAILEITYYDAEDLMQMWEASRRDSEFETIDEQVDLMVSELRERILIDYQLAVSGDEDPEELARIRDEAYERAEEARVLFTKLIRTWDYEDGRNHEI